MFPDASFSAGAAGTTGAAFLKLAQAARAQALGDAITAGAEGTDALFSNPAGLASLGPESPADLSLSYNDLLETSYLGYAAYGRAFGRDGAIGADAIYFSQAAMTRYNGQGDAVGSFQPNDFAVALAYARRFQGFTLGGSVKMIHSSLDDVSGTGAALDFGAQAKSVCLLGDRPLDVGARFSNFGPPIKLGGASAPLPLSLAGGLLWHPTPAVNPSVDVHLPADQDPYVSLGVEANFWFDQQKRKASLRVGYDQSHGRDSDGIGGVTAGAGLDLGAFRFDYAWDPYGDLGMQNRITLAFRF